MSGVDSPSNVDPSNVDPGNVDPSNVDLGVLEPLDAPPGGPFPLQAGLDLFGPALEPLTTCVQDPVFHREGDAWTHTRLVCEKLWTEEPALAALPRWRRVALAAAALLHDIAKPGTRQVDAEGRVHHPHHTTRGAIDAERLLWEAGAPFALRRLVVALVRHHILPFKILHRDRPARLAHALSLQLPSADLAALARADARGRDADDLQRVLDDVALFEQLCAEEGCAEGPRAFPSDHSRVLYFHKEVRAVDHLAHDETWGEVVVLSGLPGAGKSHLAATRFAHRQVIEVDAIRQQLGVSPRAKQGGVFAVARQRARELLREHQPFVWSATSLSRRTRRPLIELCLSYGARVRVVYVEVCPDRLWQQNRERGAAVPEAAIRRMMRQWEVPTLVEAHAVEHLVDGVPQPDLITSRA